MTTNSVLCTCYKKEGHYCKNWNGNGDASRITSEVKAMCENNQTDPDKCKFLVKPIPRTGCDWLYQTVSGSPIKKEKPNA